MSFFNTEIIIPMVEMYLPLVGIHPYSKERVDTYRKMTQAAVDVTSHHLLHPPVGEQDIETKLHFDSALANPGDHE